MKKAAGAASKRGTSPAPGARKDRSVRRWWSPRAPGRASGPLPKGKSPVLGIEVTRGGLRFVELQTVGGRIACRSYGEIAFGASEDIGAVLRLLVEEHSIEAKDVHLVDSSSRAKLKIQTFPDMPAADLDLIVRGEIESEAELLGDALVGDWCRLNQAGEEAEILVGKAPARDRAALVQACESAGLRLQVMSSSSQVLAHHCVSVGEVPAGEMVGLLDIGRTKMNMALISDERVLLVREVYQGLSASFLRGDDNAPAADLDAIGAGLDEVVGTVEQIRRTLHQFQEGRPDAHLHHLIMTGETTRISRFLGLLQHDLQVPVRPYDPAAHLRDDLLPETLRVQAPAFAVPWVLAQTPAHAFPLNFAEGVPDLRPVRAVQAVGAAAAVAALAMGVVYAGEARDVERAQTTVAQLQSEKSYLQSELGLIREVKVRWDRWVKEQRAGLDLPAPDLRPYLAEVTAAMPENLRLVRVEFSRGVEKWQAEIDGVAFSETPSASHAVMNDWLAELQESPLVESVELLPVVYKYGRSQRWRDEVAFTVVVQWHRIGIPSALDPMAAPQAEPPPIEGGA